MSVYDASYPHPRYKRNKKDYYPSGRKRCRTTAGGNSIVRASNLLHSASPRTTLMGSGTNQSQERTISGTQTYNASQSAKHTRRSNNSYKKFTQPKTWDFRHARQTRERGKSPKNKYFPRRDVMLAENKFSTKKAKSTDANHRQQALNRLVPQLVAAFENNVFGASHIQRDMDNPKKKYLQPLTIKVCAQDLLAHLLKWVNTKAKERALCIWKAL